MALPFYDSPFILLKPSHGRKGSTWNFRNQKIDAELQMMTSTRRYWLIDSSWPAEWRNSSRRSLNGKKKTLGSPTLSYTVVTVERWFHWRQIRLGNLCVKNVSCFDSFPTHSEASSSSDVFYFFFENGSSDWWVRLVLIGQVSPLVPHSTRRGSRTPVYTHGCAPQTRNLWNVAKTSETSRKFGRQQRECFTAPSFNQVL